MVVTVFHPLFLVRYTITAAGALVEDPLVVNTAQVDLAEAEILIILVQRTQGVEVEHYIKLHQHQVGLES